MKTPDYVLIQEHTVYLDSSKTLTLAPGTFMRPIAEKWLPKHVTEDPRWKYYDKAENIFAFCHYGIIMIPKRLLRQV